jgi:hypothetical protein
MLPESRVFITEEDAFVDANHWDRRAEIAAG